MVSTFLITFAAAFVSPSSPRNAAAFLAAEPYGFEAIRTLDFRLEKLELSAPDILGNFYEPALKSFSIVPGTVTVSSMSGHGRYAHPSLRNFERLCDSQYLALVRESHKIHSAKYTESQRY